MTEQETRLRELIEQSHRIVFFGGAGVSTESNVPDFRSDEGLYAANQQRVYPDPPETMLSHSFFVRNPERFYQFYFDKMVYPEAKPNPAHLALARLERQGRLMAVVTQNIDGLHQMAGSKRVYELHGSIHRNHCLRCGRFYDAAFIRDSEGVPHCECGGIVKPDVVLYEEALDDEVVEGAVDAIECADLMIIGGTSLAVYPAAGLLRYFRGDTVVQINRDHTPYDARATLSLHESIGKVLGAIRV